MKRKSIKHKLRMLISLIALALAASIAAASIVLMFQQRDNIEAINASGNQELYSNTKDKLENMSLEIGRNMTEQYKQRINQNFLSIQNDIQTMAYYLDLLYKRGYSSEQYDRNKFALLEGTDLNQVKQEVMKIQDVRGLIQSLPHFNPEYMDFLYLYIVTETGIFIEGTDRFTGISDFAEVRNSDWYEGGKGKAGTEDPYFWTSMYMGEQTGTERITCTVPFYDENEKFAGVAAGDISKEFIAETVLDIQDEQLDYILLYDENNKLMINPYNYPKADQLEVSDGYEIDDEEIIMFAELPANGWKLGLIFQQRAVTDTLSSVETAIRENGDKMRTVMSANIKKSITVCFYITLAGLILAPVISTLAAHSFVKPILLLTEEVKAAGAGDLTRKVSVKSKDEIGNLAECFNNMTTELTNYMGNLEEMAADKERTEAEQNVARKIQSNLLPHGDQTITGRTDMNISGQLEMAKEGGGNFYDYFFTNENHFYIIAGNAAGGGILSSVLSMTVRTHIKNFARMGYKAARILTEANNQLAKDNETGISVSIFLAVADMSAGTMEYANAGFPVPFFKHSAEEFMPLEGKLCFPLGTMENVPYTAQSVQLSQGDLLCLYSSGVPDLTDSRDNLYTAEHFNDFLNDIVKKEFGLEEISVKIKEDLDHFSEGREKTEDWLTVIFRYFG